VKADSCSQKSNQTVIGNETEVIGELWKCPDYGSLESRKENKWFAIITEKGFCL
jgi:hypothetical protein